MTTRDELPDLDDVLADLVTESDELAQVLASLDEPQWRRSTPAPEWTIAHQVAHLAADFYLAGLAAGDPAEFEALLASGGEFDDKVAAALAPFVALPPQALLSQYRQQRDAGVAALGRLSAQTEVPWLARRLPAGMLAAAGIMEVFAHGQDIADALGTARQHTDRLRHVVRFALGNWDYAYQVRELTPPETSFGYELTAPSGAVWRFGPADAPQRITGPAVDFCLLVTRRRHRADLAVQAVGADADHWLDIAQGYRGAPGPGRAPGQFRA